MNLVVTLWFWILVAVTNCSEEEDITLKIQELPGDGTCLDGTPATAYVYAPLHSEEDSTRRTFNQTVLHLQGGTWCYGMTEEETLRSCNDWSFHWKGSSSWREDPKYKTRPLHDYLELQAFRTGYNIVFVNNCDRSSFSSTAGEVKYDDDHTIHFEGFKILQGALKLVESYNQTRVVFSGTSSGALSVYMHVDYVREALSRSEVEVLAAPDSGFFLDMPARNGTDVFPEQMRQHLAVAKSHISNEACKNRYGGDEKWKCLFVEYFAENIDTPMFIANSLIDKSEVDATLYVGKKCESNVYWNLDLDFNSGCTQAEKKSIGELVSGHRQKMKPLLNKPSNGYYLPNCGIHGIYPSKLIRTSSVDALHAWLKEDHRPDVVRELGKYNNDDAHQIGAEDDDTHQIGAGDDDTHLIGVEDDDTHQIGAPYPDPQCNTSEDEVI